MFRIFLHKTSSSHFAPIILFSLFFLISSCVQSSSNGDSTSTTPTTPTTGSATLTISSQSPTKSATDQAVSIAISVVFSAALDSSTVTSSTFTVTTGGQAIASSAPTVSDQTATITPSSDLLYDTDYTVTVTTGVKDSNENFLAADESWTFHTEGGSVTVLDITTGEDHSCALLDNGTVKCWGQNNRGQLGIGSTTNQGVASSQMGSSLSTVNVGTGRLTLQLASGLNHTCGLLDDGSVKCWGGNTYGQLGIGSTIDIGGTSTEMGDALSAVSFSGTLNAVQLVAGQYHTCAKLDNSQVICWGRNDKGQLGQGNKNQIGDSNSSAVSSASVVDVSSDTTDAVIEITAGANHTCVRTFEGEIKCWGKNSFGQLGVGTVANISDDGSLSQMGGNLAAVALGTGRKAISVSSGFDHTCALMDNSQVKCWGSNEFGQLGQDDTTNVGDSNVADVSNDSAIALGSTVIQVSAGGNHTCALLDDGSLKCWGKNQVGQLGLENNPEDNPDARNVGDQTGEIAALSAVSLGTGVTATKVTTGANHTCVRLNNGRTKCWGDNAKGQLGLGNTTDIGAFSNQMGDNLSSIDLGTGEFVAVQIVTGLKHSCVILGFNSVKCWGLNDQGQLGLGHTNSIGDDSDEMGNNLSAVSLNGTAVELAAGTKHTCARLDDGSVKCWGANDQGQLGLGDTLARGDDANEMGSNLSVVSLGAKKAIQITAGEKHTCVLLNDATARCWGDNSKGQLGIDTIDDQTSPVTDVILSDGIVQLEAGTNFTCARLDTGQVRCWGDNSNGQLGQNSAIGAIGTLLDKMSGLADINLTGTNGSTRIALSISIGYAHVCALLDDGSIKCWGDGSEGALGSGNSDAIGDTSSVMGNLASIQFSSGSSSAVTLADSGNQHNCVRFDDGTIKCWGINDRGRLGIGEQDSRGDDPNEMISSELVVKLGKSVVELAAGGTHTCARLVNGRIKCWGANADGQLGLGHTDDIGDESGEMGTGLVNVELQK